MYVCIILLLYMYIIIIIHLRIKSRKIKTYKTNKTILEFSMGMTNTITSSYLLLLLSDINSNQGG